MNKEDKELLLKYLCMALPYNTQISIVDNRFQCYGVHLNWRLIGEIEKYDAWNNIKPYLRPMSSMNEEEEEELRLLKNQLVDCDENNDEKFYRIINEIHNLYLSHHIDFMGLIPKGLAIEVTEDNNPYKE